jgi:DNA-binding NarL/FixJ family response regulator/tetratricopeptide (TPR) repeat protein
VATVVSSRLIGREQELAALSAALREAADGRPALALVAGESGVGKTRLLSELARAARDEGVRVLTGECVELGEGELPYAPLIGALRPLLRAADPALAELPLPVRRELGALLPGLGGEPEDGAAAEQRPADAQPRLFEALLAALDRLAADAPLLLILEDVHWADRSTRDFLAFLSRNLAEERVLAVLSYRPDELHRRHPLRPLLAALERAPTARRVELRGLGREAVAELARDILGAEPAGDLVDRLAVRSEGNALFVEELLAAGPGPLPPSLSDALMLRIERLPAAAQEVVRVLAVAQPADHALLADVAGLEGVALTQALRDAIAGHVVVVAHDDRYAFRHVLLREVAYDDLLPGERGALHLAVARALERRLDSGEQAPALTAAVAHHFHAAGDQPEALRSAVRAAQAADALHARADAALLLERALELWDRVPGAEQLVGFDHVDLLRHAAAAHRASDEPRRLTLIAEAIREVRAADPEDRRVSMLLRDRSMTEWALGRGEASRATLDLARRLLAGDAPASDRLALTVSRLKLAMLQSRYAEAIELGAEAEAGVSGLGEPDEELRLEIDNSVGFALIMVGEHDRGCDVLRGAIELSIAREDAATLGISYLNLADALQLRGRAEEARQIVDEALCDRPFGIVRGPWLLALAAELAIDRGDFAAAREHLDRIGRTSGNTRVNVELRLTELALALGDADGARAALDEAVDVLADSLEPQFVAVAGVLRAELERRAGDLGAARAAVESALERVEFCSDDTVRLGRLATAGVAVEADAAQRARDLGDPEAEAAALARAEPMLARARAAAAEDGPLERALLATAEAQWLRATGAPSTDAWRTAASAWVELGRPPRAAAALRRGAESCLAHGDREAGAAALREALALARSTGSTWVAEELEALAARGRLPVVAADGTAGETAGETAAGPVGGAANGAAAREHADPFGLTPRERQVLCLVAGGATNREIGAELFMAEKTASVHVSRILAKLDVRSRTEAAAVAHRLGLS